MTAPPIQSRASSAGPRRNALELRLAELEREREQLIREKRRNMLFAGAAISLIVHLAILSYLGLIIRASGTGIGDEGGTFEFAIVSEEELTGLDRAELESSAPAGLTDLAEATETSMELELDAPPGAQLSASGSDSGLALGGGGSGAGGGGGGEGDGLGLGGGGASTTFFGGEGRGERFLFIVDISGSMSESNKFRLAMGELIRSISSLPDFAHFHVILFETEIHWPPGQDGWVRARVRDVDRLVQWIETVQPGGGTQPLPAFQRAFGLDVAPDVIFFLTDGQIADETTPAQILNMNQNRGKRVVINTVAFGDPRAQDMLRQIANDSGGTFKFVQVGGTP